ncbi:hypothetical protein Scep_019645 [Stephania cephalantha]|uniref:BAG family molecular chaperone regulator 8, chloroplastic n=1 Tax=Stephania cephalantha TaxID=152367 RepID=A0AAP0IC53_9MAGN
MASHRHHHHHQLSCNLCCCCSCCSCYASPSPHQSLPDPLIQAIAAAHLLQSPQPTHHHHHHPYTTHFPNPQHYNNNNTTTATTHHHHRQQEQEHNTHLLITSLLHRIDALEASIPKIKIPAVDSGFGDSREGSSLPLRDLAARTIQTHFRAFLARRSGALRSLKELAVIRSSLNALKASAHSANTRLKSHALSLKSMDLLHRLHSIQDSDPMVRRGKRSISRELVRFLESLDRIPMTKQVEVASSKVMKKNVSFVEPSRKSRVSVRTREPLSSEDVFDLNDDQIELVENLCRRVEDIGAELTDEISDVNEEEQVSDEESSQPTSNGVNKVKNGKKNFQVVLETSGDEFSFAPPLPVQMEPRRG